MTDGRLFIISGPSGVGKSTLLREVFRRRGNMYFSVSVTTREPRVGEKDGVDYHFISVEEYEALLKTDMLLEHAEYGGNLYGTPLEPILENMKNGVDVILDIESVGMGNVKAKRPDAISVFIAPPDWETLESRLRGRKTETEDTIQKRLKAAKNELAASGRYDHIVVNDAVERAADALCAIMDNR